MKLNISQILKGIGQVTTTINPAIGSGLMLAGAIADEFDGVPDNVLEENFIGFSKSSQILRDVAKNLNGEDKEKVLLVADNLDGIAKLLNKFEKLLK